MGAMTTERPPFFRLSIPVIRLLIPFNHIEYGKAKRFHKVISERVLTDSRAAMLTRSVCSAS